MSSVEVSIAPRMNVFCFVAMMDDPVEGVYCELDEANVLEWQVWVEGSKGSA